VEFNFRYTNRGIYNLKLGMFSGSGFKNNFINLGTGRVNLKRMEFSMKIGLMIRKGFPEFVVRDLIFKIHDWDLSLNGFF
jgi:hypothetical protein